MTFDESGICVLESITSVDECEAYKEFLRREGHRHASDLEEMAVYGGRLRAIDTVYTHAAAEFYNSAVKRHGDDLVAIGKRLLEIEAHKAKLEGK
jgi:hypothetical protein